MQNKRIQAEEGQVGNGINTLKKMQARICALINWKESRKTSERRLDTSYVLVNYLLTMMKNKIRVRNICFDLGSEADSEKQS